MNGAGEAPATGDRAAALALVPATTRDAVALLWRLDAHLGAIVASPGDPAIRRIKLAWWRDALEALDDRAPPAQPLLEACAATLLPALRGAELAALEEGWAILLGAGTLSAENLEDYARGRGGRLFALTTRLIDGPVEAERAGEGWALVDLARRSSRADERSAALAAARAALAARTRLPRALGLLAMLARRDVARGALEAETAPRRLLRTLAFGLIGR